MSLGDAWTNTTAASVSKLNTSTVIYGTGAYLTGLDKTKHKLVVCTATGSGFTVDHVYLADNAGTSWIDVSDIGNVIEVFQANPKFFDLALTRTNDLQSAQWNTTTVSSGTVANDTDGTTGERSIKLLTGATSGGAETISYPHLKLDFAGPSMFQAKIRLSATTSLAYHAGVGADDVTAADSNTVKYNAEVCTATNTNWFLRTASGSANSTSDTGIAFTTNRVALRIDHDPSGNQAFLTIDAATAFQKTSNIPTSGATANNNLIKHSLKNSTTADKNCYVYGSRLYYTVNDNWV